MYRKQTKLVYMNSVSQIRIYKVLYQLSTYYYPHLSWLSTFYEKYKQVSFFQVSDSSRINSMYNRTANLEGIT